MRNRFIKVRDYLVTSGKLIWHRLPKIALYTIAIYTIFFVIGGVTQALDRRAIAAAPGTDFLNYTSFTVQNAREGEDVTFTLCREHKENYDINGIRTVYIIPEGKTEAEKVFVYNKRIEGIIDTGNCQPYFIKQSEYHFRPGKYMITLNINFRVKYDIPKSVYTKSGIFTIYPQPNSGGDMQAQLNNLQQQLRDQQLIIDRLINNGTIQTPTSASNTQNQGGEASDGGPINTNPSQEPQPAQPATPQRPTREVCDPLLNILGIRIGSINCRQEPV